MKFATQTYWPETCWFLQVLCNLIYLTDSDTELILEMSDVFQNSKL